MIDGHGATTPSIQQHVFVFEKSQGKKIVVFHFDRQMEKTHALGQVAHP